MAEGTKQQQLTRLLKQYVEMEEQKKNLPQKYLSERDMHYVGQCPLGSKPCDESKEVCPPRFMGLPFYNEMHQQCFGENVTQKYRKSQEPSGSGKVIGDIHRFMAGIAELKMKLSPLTIRVQEGEGEEKDLNAVCKHAQEWMQDPTAKTEDKRALCEMMGTDETRDVWGPLGRSACTYDAKGETCRVRSEFEVPFQLFIHPLGDDKHANEIVNKLVKEDYFDKATMAMVQELQVNESARAWMKEKSQAGQLTDNDVETLKQIFSKILREISKQYPDQASQYPSVRELSEIIDLYRNYFAKRKGKVPKAPRTVTRKEEPSAAVETQPSLPAAVEIGEPGLAVPLEEARV